MAIILNYILHEFRIFDGITFVVWTNGNSQAEAKDYRSVTNVCCMIFEYICFRSV